MQAPVLLKGELLKSFHQFALDRKELAGLHRTENIAATQEWTEALGLPSQEGADSSPAHPEEPYSFEPDDNFDPASANEMDPYVWGFGLDEE